MPTLPLESRKATRYSPRTLSLIGGESGSGTSSGSRTGSQKRRKSSPMGVPELVWVIRALSSALSIGSMVVRRDGGDLRVRARGAATDEYHGRRMYNGVKVLDVHGHVTSPE